MDYDTEFLPKKKSRFPHQIGSGEIFMGYCDAPQFLVLSPRRLSDNVQVQVPYAYKHQPSAGSLGFPPAIDATVPTYVTTTWGFDINVFGRTQLCRAAILALSNLVALRR